MKTWKLDSNQFFIQGQYSFMKVSVLFTFRSNANGSLQKMQQQKIVKGGKRKLVSDLQRSRSLLLFYEY